MPESNPHCEQGEHPPAILYKKKKSSELSLSHDLKICGSWKWNEGRVWPENKVGSFCVTVGEISPCVTWAGIDLIWLEFRPAESALGSPTCAERFPIEGAESTFEGTFELFLVISLPSGVKLDPAHFYNVVFNWIAFFPFHAKASPMMGMNGSQWLQANMFKLWFSDSHAHWGWSSCVQEKITECREGCWALNREAFKSILWSHKLLTLLHAPQPNLPVRTSPALLSPAHVLFVPCLCLQHKAWLCISLKSSCVDWVG